MSPTDRRLGSLGARQSIPTKTQPASPAAQKAYRNMHKAVELHKRGQLPEAEKLYRKVLKIVPGNFDALRFLGAIALSRGKFDEAARIFQKALLVKPTNVDVLNEYGDTLLHLNRPEEALEIFRVAEKATPKSLVTLNNVGNALTILGKHEEAVDYFHRALSIKPDAAEVHNNLGRALGKLSLWNEAIGCFERALEINPALHYVYMNLGSAYRRIGRDDLAVECFRKGAMAYPDSAEMHNKLGSSLRELGRVEEAEKEFRQSIALKPDFDEAISNLGSALSVQGKSDEAISCFRSALAVNGESTQNYRLLSARTRFREYDLTISEIESKFNKQKFNPDQKSHLAFALFKAFEDIGDYEQAFYYLDLGNKFRRECYEYSLYSDIDLFSKIKSVFNQDFLSDSFKVTESEPIPIFIVGMPRSGTTLVEQILASHPRVFGAGELAILPALIQHHFGYMRDEGFPCEIPAHDPSDMDRLGRDYLSSIRVRAPSFDLITDKAPMNFMWIGLIKLALPNAKIVHCTRDPIDNCFSIFKQYFTATGHFYAYNLTELGEFYQLYQDMMVHWRHVMADSILDVRYEKLVEDQENQTRRLLDYCDLEWDDACLKFYETRRVVNTASEFQVRQPIYKSSVEAWRRYEKFLKPLIDALESGVPGLSTRGSSR